MKKLSLLFKAFKLDNISMKKIILVTTITAVVVGASCQVKRIVETGNPFGLAEQSHEDILKKAIRIQSDSAHPLVWLENDACDEQAQVASWHFYLQNPFGNSLVVAKHPLSVGPQVINVFIDNTEIQITDAKPITKQMVTDICNEFDNSKNGQVIISELLQSKIADWLEATAPDCEFSYGDKSGWTCQLESINAKTALREILGVKHTMIRRWSRQPYLLARRLAVSESLATILTAKKDRRDSELNVFCKMISHSLPEELPLTISSKTWQKSVCDNNNTLRFEAAHFGLSKAVAEIDFMRILFENTSRLGYFSVKIPTQDVPEKNLWVRLIPKEDVSLNLIEMTSKLFASDKEKDRNEEFCWHPVYGESPSLMNVSRQLRLSELSEQVVCSKPSQDTATTELTEAAQYLSDSLMSEAEFVVTNGRAKLLRLPLGNYDYSIQGLPGDPAIWDEVEGFGNISQGTVAWGGKTPRPVVRNW